MSRGNFGGYEDSNGYGAMVPYQEEYKPQIYRVRFPLFSRPYRRAKETNRPFVHLGRIF